MFGIKVRVARFLGLRGGGGGVARFSGLRGG